MWTNIWWFADTSHPIHMPTGEKRENRHFSLKALITLLRFMGPLKELVENGGHIYFHILILSVWTEMHIEYLCFGFIFSSVYIIHLMLLTFALQSEQLTDFKIKYPFLFLFYIYLSEVIYLIWVKYNHSSAHPVHFNFFAKESFYIQNTLKKPKAASDKAQNITSA